jgi:hypothetical protein
MLAFMLRARSFQEGRVGQNVRGRLGLTEELLRREQGAPFCESGWGWS